MKLALPISLLFAILVPLSSRSAHGAGGGQPQLYFGHNVIANPGAEAGQGSADGSVVGVPGWTTYGNFTAVKYGCSCGIPNTMPGPKHPGSNLFTGGPHPSSPEPAALQIMSLAPLQRFVVLGRVGFTLSGWLGGYSADGDNATVYVYFEDVSQKMLTVKQIGPVSNTDRGNVTELLYRHISGMVPGDAAYMGVYISMQWQSGAYTDGYADNLSLVLSPPKNVDYPVEVALKRRGKRVAESRFLSGANGLRIGYASKGCSGADLLVTQNGTYGGGPWAAPCRATGLGVGFDRLAVIHSVVWLMSKSRRSPITLYPGDNDELRVRVPNGGHITKVVWLHNGTVIRAVKVPRAVDSLDMYALGVLVD
jgi:hypothetical protein